MKRTRLPALTLALVTLAAPLPLAVGAAPPTLELAIAPALELTPLAAAAKPAIVAGDDTTAPLPPLSPNPRDWFVDHLALAATIAMVVQFLKKNVLRSLSGLSTVLASLATGVVLSAAGTLNLPLFGRLHDLSLGDAVMFGLEAAIIASGGWDAIKGLLGLGNSVSARATA